MRYSHLKVASFYYSVLSNEVRSVDKNNFQNFIMRCLELILLYVTLFVLYTYIFKGTL